MKSNSTVSKLLLLVIRNFLLWIVVPLASIVWVALAWPLHRREISFAQYLGWVDLNVIASLQRGVLRPLTKRRLPFVPPRQMASVTHRIKAADAFDTVYF